MITVEALGGSMFDDKIPCHISDHDNGKSVDCC